MPKRQGADDGTPASASDDGSAPPRSHGATRGRDEPPEWPPSRPPLEVP